MAVVPISRLLLKPPPLSPPTAPLRSSLPCQSRLIVPAKSSPLRFPSLLPFPPSGRACRFYAQSNGGASETLEESEAEEVGKKAQEEESEEKDAAASAAASSSVAEELKQMMEARRKESSSSSELLSGVAEEVREIEWPSFGKVLGTTGVVLAVIAGSSVALLTVNAILAEISDKVFAGKGIQDFF
ncbi:hypothetical protein Cni_G28598 [Canna indica]|uniref:Preprotein translocase subunit SECE1 n=1 Tax=Canna indica TaxID=4628 RepID=A0AAQ3L7M8_9LILI|nr:hypothetical protein Cni_G28598 [Canna indica]